MSEEPTPAEQALLHHWIQRSDEALRDAGREENSRHTRTAAAFESGYACALYLVGPRALQPNAEHPSQGLLRTAAEIGNVDVQPGLLHLQRLLDDPVNMPSAEEMLRWAHLMRKRLPSER